MKSSGTHGGSIELASATDSASSSAHNAFFVSSNGGYVHRLTKEMDAIDSEYQISLGVIEDGDSRFFFAAGSVRRRDVYSILLLLWPRLF